MKVFICHATKDKPFVRRLDRELTRSGVDVWVDEKEIRVGNSLRRTIEAALEDADYVLVVLTKHSLTREWVQKELSAAFSIEIERRRDVILPVLLESTKVPLFLRDKKYADFSLGFAHGMKGLLGVFESSGHFSRPTNLETTKCTVVIDLKRLDGSLAVYKKNQTLRCVRGIAEGYREAFTSDGTIDSFQISRGKIEREWEESGVTYVDTKFDTPLKTGQELARTFSCTWRDSFMSSLEYWEEKQHHPSKDVELIIKFPKGRPPKKWETQERDGAATIASRYRASMVTILGKPSLRLRIPNPRLRVGYLLKWEW